MDEIRIIKKPSGILGTERLKVELENAQTLDDIVCMVMRGIGFLHGKRFFHASGGTLYLSLRDAEARPLTFFADGTPIAGHLIKVPGPYKAAADHYDRKFSPGSPGLL